MPLSVIPLPRRRGLALQSILLTADLLRIRALAVRREWSSSTIHVAAASAGATLFSLIYLGTYLGVHALWQAGAIGLLSTVPPWALLIYLLTDVVIAFGQALGDLYASRDVPLLLTMPIRVPALITSKFVLGVMQNEIYAAVFLLPFVLGYLSALQAPWIAYPVMMIGIAVFPAILYAALVVVTILALRVVPARLAKESLWLIGAVVPTAFWITMFYRIAHITGDVTVMSLPTPPGWLPSTWLGWALASFGGASPGGVGAGIGWTGLLLFETFAVCPPALWLVSYAFARGWSDSFATGAAKPVDPLGAIAPRRSGLRALVLKDLLAFVRTPQLWFNHIGALMFVVYLLVGHAVQTPIFPLTLQLAMVQIGFVAILGSVTPGMTALSLEHDGIWFLRSAPLNSRDILIAKVLVPFAQTGTIAAIGGALLSAGYGFPIGARIVVVAFGILMAACSVSLGVAFDTRFPSFAWENPNAINRGPRMVIPFLNGLAMLVICCGALFFSRDHWPGVTGLVIGIAISVAFSALMVWQTLVRASKNLQQLEV